MKLFAPVRPDERRAVGLAFATLLGIMASHSLLETARDALFLSRLPASRLAWVYLAVAAVSLALFALQARAGRVRAGRAALVAWLLGASAVDTAFWFAIHRSGTAVLYALYLWSGVFATLVVVRFWTLVGELFTVGQAKRLFALIGSGSVLGAIVGGAIGRILAGGMEIGSLLLASAALLVLTAVGPVLWLPQPSEVAASRSERGRSRAAAAPGAPPVVVHAPGAAWRDVVATARLVAERPYLRGAATLVLLSTVTLTSVDFLFKSAAAAHVPKADLGAFFAGTTLVFNIASLVVQVAGVGWLVRTQRIDRVLSVLPAMLVPLAAAVAAGGGFVAAFALKACDGALRHSVHRTATEVLFVPLAATIRSRVKGLVDVVGQRGGQAIASLVILLSLAVPGGARLLAVVVGLLALAWLVAARRLKKHYVDLFRDTLSEVAVRTRFEFPELDLASLEALIQGLNSTRDAEVLAALDFLVEQDRVRLVPALLLYHPSPAIVVRGLELFTAAGREDVLPITERLLEHPDAEVRAATLRARAWLSPSAELYARFVTDPSPIVVATALVGQVSYGGTAATAARQRMQQLLDKGSLDEATALARAIRTSPGAGYEGVLLALAALPDARVRLETARAMREILAPRFIPALFAMLPDQSLRLEARATLVALGADALARLDAALTDRSVDVKIRRQLPRTIGQFGAAAAAGILMRHLRDEPEGAVRFRILRTLARLQDDDPRLGLDRKTLEDALEAALASVRRVLAWRVELAAHTQAVAASRTPVQELVGALLEHKELQAMERVFLLLGLLHPEENVRSVQRGLRSRDRAVRASSLELLDNVLRAPFRAPVLALVDDLPDAERLARAGGGAPRHGAGYETLLGDLLERGGLGMRALVAYHAGEMRLHGLRDRIGALPRDHGGLLEPVVQRTMVLLAEARREA